MAENISPRSTKLTRLSILVLHNIHKSLLALEKQVLQKKCTQFKYVKVSEMLFFKKHHIRVVNDLPEFNYEQLLGNILFWVNKNSFRRIKLQNLECLFRWAKPKRSLFVKVEVVVSMCVRIAKALKISAAMNRFLLELARYCKTNDYKWISLESRDIEEAVKSRYYLT